jgi:hypothetical protein
MARETAIERRKRAAVAVWQWFRETRTEPGFYGPRTPVQAVYTMREGYLNDRWPIGDLDRGHIRAELTRFGVVDTRWTWEDFDAWRASGEVPERILEDDRALAALRKARLGREAAERLAAARDAKAPRNRSATVRGYWIGWRRSDDASEVVIRGERLRGNDPLVTAFVGGVLARRADQRMRRISEDRLGTVTVVFQHRTDAPLRWNDVTFAFDRAADEVLGREVKAPPRASRVAAPAESPRSATAPREVEPFALTAPAPARRKPEQLGLFGRVSGLLKDGG